jgi:bifunctional DNA-binding transcriptional regulator/antitoxin component of YhaV-PrlF toxin-antitoxin module
MPSWQDRMDEERKPRPTRVSRNGQVVLAARARREARIQPGDLVVSVPVAPGAVLVEKVGAQDPESVKRELEREDNPLRGLWGPDPDAWVAEIRSRWREREVS